MVHANGSTSNGYNGHTLICESDYPDVKAVDVTPKRTPRWQDQVAKYTHNLSWVDADSCQHSMTIRADSLQELLDDLKLIKKGIQIAKAKSGKQNVPEETGDIPVCPIHGVTMERRTSKRTGGQYFAHKTGPKELCFGRERH